MAVPKKDPEVEAMAKVIEALDGLDLEMQARLLRWAAERHGITLTGKTPPGGAGGSIGGSGEGAAEAAAATYEEVGDLVAAAEPSTDEDRALVVAYWLQEVRVDSSRPSMVNR